MIYTMVYTIFLLYIYRGIYHGIYHLPILYIPWYIPKVVYITFGVVYTMRQPSRWCRRCRAPARTASRLRSCVTCVLGCVVKKLSEEGAGWMRQGETMNPPLQTINPPLKERHAFRDASLMCVCQSVYRPLDAIGSGDYGPKNPVTTGLRIR
jgi:hypothetical protein